MKTVYLVRHGESEINVSKTFVDYVMSPLTELGREQARLLAARAAKLDFERLIASPIERTRETAEYISKSTGHSIEFAEVFRERNLPASLIGKSKDDPEARLVADAAILSSEEDTAKVEETETFSELKVRAGEALTYLEQRPESSIMVVGHGYFTRMLIARMWFGASMTPAEFKPFIWGMRTKNTGISVLRFDPTDTHRPWWMLVWNDHAHLG